MSFERCSAYISKSALLHNIRLIRSKLEENTFLFAVVKADAYGHGSVSVSSVIEDEVDGFAVAGADEGCVLREAGIKKPILILGYTSSQQYEQIINENIMPAIWRLEDAVRLNSAAKRLRRVADIHIAVDSGMNRIGFKCDEQSECDIQKISRLSNIRINGIFTHLSCADMDSEDARDYTDEQIGRFSALIRELELRGVNIPLKHAYNSAAIIERDNGIFNCVRSGIVNYGLYPSDEVKHLYPELEPVMQFKARVINVCSMPAGSKVGYGATFISDKDMKVATVSAGYADGFPRLLSNRGRVLIRGMYAKILGRVCMDQFMADVTDIPDVSIEDEVTLFGSDSGNILPVEEVAVCAGTINYEIVCGISKRVPRILIS